MLLTATIFVSFFLSTAVRLVFERILLDPLPLFGPGISLLLQENAGIAFGIDLPLTIFAPLVVIAFIVLFIAAIRQRDDQIAGFGYGLILGGALANLLDRLDDGMVTDFVAVFSFPVFNLADSCITIGVAAVLLPLLTSSRRGSGSGRAAGDPVPR